MNMAKTGKRNKQETIQRKKENKLKLKKSMESSYELELMLKLHRLREVSAKISDSEKRRTHLEMGILLKSFFFPHIF